MHDHFTWFGVFSSDANVQKFILALLVGFGLIGVGRIARARVGAAPENHIVPSERFGLFELFDLMIESFIKFQDSIIGVENRKFFPLCASVFFFLFFSNIIGLIPGMPGITTTVWVNVGIALVVFTAYNYYGIKENGLVGYLKHFCGPIWWIAPMFFLLEIISNVFRILTLNLRLYWNITADHILVGIFTDLTKVLVPCIFYALGTFVSFMQAFVFTVLTMIYILLATQHEEEH